MTADSEHLAAALGDRHRIARELGQGGMPAVSMVSIRLCILHKEVCKLHTLMRETEQDARKAELVRTSVHNSCSTAGA